MTQKHHLLQYFIESSVSNDDGFYQEQNVITNEHLFVDQIEYLWGSFIYV